MVQNFMGASLISYRSVLVFFILFVGDAIADNLIESLSTNFSEIKFESDLLSIVSPLEDLGGGVYTHTGPPLILSKFGNGNVEYISVNWENRNDERTILLHLLESYGNPEKIEIPKLWEGVLFESTGYVFKLRHSSVIVFESNSMGVTVTFVANQAIFDSLVVSSETLEELIGNQSPDEEPNSQLTIPYVDNLLKLDISLISKSLEGQHDIANEESLTINGSRSTEKVRVVENNQLKHSNRSFFPLIITLTILFLCFFVIALFWRNKR